MNTLDLLNQHIPCWTIAHTWSEPDVYHPGCTCGWSGIPCASDNEVLDQHQAHLAREIDRQMPTVGAAQIKDGAVPGTQIYSPSAEGELGVLQSPDGRNEGRQDRIEIAGFPDLVDEVGGDRELRPEFRIFASDGAPISNLDSERPNGESAAFHDDSSTGDGPAATGSTDSVEVTARRGDDSDPGELGDLRQAWRDVVTDYAAGRLQITVSSIDADTHWCRLHRLMQANTGEALS